MPAPARLLLVDDEKSVTFTLSKVLENAGYGVLTASTIPEARTLIEKHAFEAAVLDLRLADGDGIEVMRILKASQPDCMAILLTGYASLESAIAAVRQGAYDYLMKPCDIEELKLTVKGAVERSAIARSLREQFHEEKTSHSRVRAYAEELEWRLNQVSGELDKKDRAPGAPKRRPAKTPGPKKPPSE